MLVRLYAGEIIMGRITEDNVPAKLKARVHKYLVDMGYFDDVGALVVLLGIPTAATGFCFWMLEHRIQKREKQKEAEEAKRQKEAAARERAREDLQIITIQGTSAAIALGEATARAVQRIPDAHCNGDMHAALDYAAKIKHAQKDFLTSQGIHAIID